MFPANLSECMDLKLYIELLYRICFLHGSSSVNLSLTGRCLEVAKLFMVIVATDGSVDRSVSMHLSYGLMYSAAQ